MVNLNKKMKNPEDEKIDSQLSRLEGIVAWFEEQEAVDVEDGLKKVKEGTELIKKLRGVLKEAENEFKEIKKDLE